MTFIHVADVHANKERKTQTLKVLSKLYDECISSHIDYVFFCGDFWDSVITNSEASGFTKIVVEMARLASVVKVIMITGTASHEPTGSLDIFKELGCEVYDTMTLVKKDDVDILCIPEPRYNNFVGGEKPAEDLIIEYLSGIKKYKKSDKPFVILYHGEVAGVRYDNNIEATSPIAVKLPLLESTNADYIAAGHIHSPQKLGKNTYYVGSTCPINFGETHDGGYNIVSINDSVDIKRESFGFPQNITLDVDDKTIESIFKKDFTNKNVKVRYTAEKKGNKKQLEQRIKESTHALSVKVNVTVPKTTNVRAKEIIEKKTSTDKLKVYGEVNGIKITPSVLRKAQELEDSMLIKYSFPKHSFDLLSVELKGAKGIKEKSEIKIDFEKYHEGVIALIGKNGRGKSTLIENCHPFPQMLTRPGKLRDHFYLQDSYRKLVYRDENGLLYRITISMAANIKTGITKYSVETNNGSGWEPVSEVDGNLESYNKYISETFGSLDIFLKTSFFAKEQTKGYADIATATKGERMDLFAKLAGLDYYSALCQTAKDNIKKLETTISAEEPLIADKSSYEETVRESAEALETVQKDITDTEEEVKENKIKLDELLKADKRYQVYKERAAMYRQNAQLFQEKIDSNLKLIDNIKSDKEMSDKKSASEFDINTYLSINERFEELEAQHNALNNRMSDIKDDIFVEHGKISSEQIKLAEVNGDIKTLKHDIDVLSGEIPDHDIDTCPTCSAKLTASKKKEINALFNDKREEKKELEKELKSLQKSKLEYSEKIKSLESSKAKIQSDLDKVLSDISNIEETCEQFQADVFKYEQNGIAELAKYEVKYSDHDSLVEKLEAENAKYKIKILGQVGGDPVPDVTKELLKTSAKKEELTEQLITVKSKKDVLEETIKHYSKLIEKATEAEQTINKQKKDLEEYQILFKAFSNTGIQALELEAIVPNIAEITNRILQQSYGDRFVISFETLRQGVKTLVEDFNIMVTDNDSGWIYPIALLSSGELIWVKQALFYAFSVVRSDNTGFKFMTRFMDEADGSLDSDMRVKYMKMISAAHLEGSASKTILITHSQEIKEVAEQIIEL